MISITNYTQMIDHAQMLLQEKCKSTLLDDKTKGRNQIELVPQLHIKKEYQSLRNLDSSQF